MSKTRDTGYLANVIQVHDTGVRIMSGSTMLMAVSSSGAVTITGEISGSDAANALLLSGTGSVGFTTTSSFLAVSSSQQQVSASYISLSGSYNTFSGSASTRITTISSSQQDISSSLLQVSASYISLSGSYNTFSGSASTRITVDSASLLQVSSSQQQISSSLLNVISIFATTGSNSFRANQSITGSLVVSSTITAQTLVVQTVTSSIVYSSGSNNFGCDLNSRQTFTGSVLITGSLTIAGASSATSYSGATIFGSTIACSPIGCFATSCATSFIGGTGTLSGDLTLQGAVTRNIKFLDNTNTNLNAQIQYDQISSTSGQLLFGTNNAGTFATRLTISNTGASTFSSTITGTTIYGSTAVCSPVGYFSGCVGIGTANPSAKLEVNVGINSLKISGRDTYVDSTEDATNANIYVTQAGVGDFSQLAGNLVLQARTQGTVYRDIIFAGGLSNGDALMTILGEGNVGIGTVSPSYKLQVNGASGTITRITDGTNNLDFYAGSSLNEISATTSLLLSTNGATRLTIACTGAATFACSVTSPYYSFTGAIPSSAASTGYIDYSGGGTRFFSVGTSGATKGAFSFYGKGADDSSFIPLTITSTGISCFACQVCAKSLWFSSNSTGQITFGSNDACNPYIVSDSSNILYLGNNNSYKILIPQDGSDMVFRTSPTYANPQTRLTITAAGIACFACQVCAPSGVKFGSGATTLNYYEQGTFTPTIQGSSTAGTGTYSHQIGVYTKIGNLVTTNVWINWSAHTGTGDMLLANFPFTSIGTSGYRASGTFGWVDGLTLTANNILTMAYTPSETKASVTQYPAGGGTASSVSMDASANLHFAITYQTT